MKALALVLSLLAGQAWGACVSNTISFYSFNNSALDFCGNYNLSVSGTVPYHSAACSAIDNFEAGPWSSGNYFTTSAGFNTAVSGQSNYTIEFYFYATASASSPVMWSANDTAGLNYIVLGSSGQVEWSARGGILSSGIGAFNLNTCYNFAITYDGTTKKMYRNNVLISSAVAAGTWGTVSAGYIGNYQGLAGQSFTGYIDDLRFSSIARTSFPTAEPVIPTLPAGWVSVTGLVKTQ